VVLVLSFVAVTLMLLTAFLVVMMATVPAVMLLLAAAPVASAQDGWTQLFNGKDFTGWKVGGDQNSFQIRDGALVAHGQVAHAFYDGRFNNHDFKNFELMVDVERSRAWLVEVRK